MDSELTWHADGKLLPVSASFNYLGLFFHQSENLVLAFQRLLQNGIGAKASLAAKFKQLHCNKSFDEGLVDAIVEPTASYGCEVWATLCFGNLQPGSNGMDGLQVKFFQQILKLRRGISPHVIFVELARPHGNGLDDSRSWASCTG